jgi:hypothetical protein
MNRVRTRDPQTHTWPSLVSPRGHRGPSHREKIEARTRAVREDNAVIVERSADAPGEGWIPLAPGGGTPIADALRPLSSERLQLPRRRAWMDP